jgi:serine/threonine protein kinase
MAADSLAGLVELLLDGSLLPMASVEEWVQLQASFSQAEDLARELVRRGWLTPFQVDQLLHGEGQQLLLGQYLLLDRLGEGGMGEVFKARHRGLGRVVALKFIRRERLTHPEAINRFRREMRAAAQLSHPNIVLAYDADEVDGRHFLVMEYVEGTDLKKVVEQRGPLPVLEACSYVRQAALGLQHAFERGWVHRDIKPANLLRNRETIKNLDFGLARFWQTREGDETASEVTTDDRFMGTPDFMAPEQAVDSHAVDIRADIYSLGCTFYYLLAGRVPFPGTTALKKLFKHCWVEPQPLEAVQPSVPQELAALVRKMMANPPERRYQTPAEVVEDVAGLFPAAAVLPDVPPADVTIGTVPLAEPVWPAGREAGGMPVAEPTRPARPAEGFGSPPPPPVAPTPTAGPQPGAAPLHNGQPQLAVSSAAEVDEGESWGKLIPAADDPTAQADTPGPGQGAGPRAPLVYHIRPPVRARPWTRFVLGAVMILGGIAAAVTALVVWLVSRQHGDGGTVTPPQNAPVLVNRAGEPGTVPTVITALRKVKAGGRIVIQDPTVDDEIHLNHQVCPKGVTIEGEEGKAVVWQGPTRPEELNALLFVDGVEDLHLRNLTFDGGDRRQKLILLTGSCAGMELDNVALRGFTRCAVLVMNCKGTAQRPVVFRNLQVGPAKAAEAGLLFDVNAAMLIKVNEYFRIQDCRFEGPYKNGPVQKGPKTNQHFDWSGHNLHVVNGKETPI